MELDWLCLSYTFKALIRVQFVDGRILISFYLVPLTVVEDQELDIHLDMVAWGLFGVAFGSHGLSGDISFKRPDTVPLKCSKDT